MSYTSTITQKGQVTIPAPIRAFLQVKPYEKVTFHTTNNQVIISPAKDFLSLRGSIKTKKSYSDEEADKAVLDFVAKEYEEKIKNT